MIEMRLPEKRAVLLHEGVLDAAAHLAFLDGHCHSLALAVAALTGWPLVAVEDAGGEIVHVAVRRPDGLIVDVTGAQQPDDLAVACGGGRVRALVREELKLLAQTKGWSEVDPRAAAWVPVVLERAEREPERAMAKPELRLTVETESAIVVRVSWCGDAELIVDVSRPGTRVDWRRYGRVTFPTDGDGLSRIEFDPAWFNRLARRWLRSSFDEARAAEKLT